MSADLRPGRLDSKLFQRTELYLGNEKPDGAEVTAATTAARSRTSAPPTRSSSYRSRCYATTATTASRSE
jgi:hypothetical protein